MRLRLVTPVLASVVFFSFFAYIAGTEVYSASGVFTITGSLHTARYSHTATLLNNGIVLVAGGHGNGLNGTALSSAELYNPSTGTFTTTGSLLGATLHTATLLSNGMVLVAAGDAFNPTTGNCSFQRGAVSTLIRYRWSATEAYHR